MGGSFVEGRKDKISSKEAASTKTKVTHVIKNNEDIKNSQEIANKVSKKSPNEGKQDYSVFLAIINIQNPA